jgi:molecular chaperone GrpE
MTEKILLETLKKHGLERFDPSEGEEKFDPNKHDAVFQAPQQGKEDGRVFFTQQRGFLLNGRVIRVSSFGPWKIAGSLC